MVLQKKKKFYLIGTNASDIEDCTLQAIDRIKNANVVVLSKKFDSKFLELLKNKKIYYQENFSTKNDRGLWEKIYDLFKFTDIVCHLIDGDPVLDEEGLQEINFFKIKHINCEIISGVIKVVNLLNCNSELLTNREKNFSSTFLKKFDKKRLTTIINNFYFEKLIIFLENNDELKQIRSFFDNLSPTIIRRFSIKYEKNKNLKNDIKIIEDLNTPSYIIIENNEKT
tara:strand:- start:178 stop:855 length:678 start_codon:yes stop_codon:yes gene_type:complete